ncbi:hypothetical protein Tco_0278378 [Tanacetum coccineum]
MVSFIKDLGYTGKCDMLSEIHIDQMHQPWRTFDVVINRCISGKSTDLDMLRPLRAQILWEDYQKYGALIPEQMINQAIPDSEEYKIYLAFATGEATPKKARKFKKITSPSKKQTPVLKEEPAKKPKQAKHPEPAKKSAPAKKDVSLKKPSRKQSSGGQIKDTPGVSVSKKKAPATTERSKGIDLLSKAALLEDAQLKKVLKQSKRETHYHQASGSGDGVGSQTKVPGELQDKATGTNEGTGTIPGVPDVPKDHSKSENEYWGESGDDDDSNDDDVSDDDGNEDDSDDDEEEYKGEYVRTPSSYKSTDDENEHVDEEEYDRINEELYNDVNVKLKDVEHGEEGK